MYRLIKDENHNWSLVVKIPGVEEMILRIGAFQLSPETLEILYASQEMQKLQQDEIKRLQEAEKHAAIAAQTKPANIVPSPLITLSQSERGFWVNFKSPIKAHSAAIRLEVEAPFTLQVLTEVLEHQNQKAALSNTTVSAFDKALAPLNPEYTPSPTGYTRAQRGIVEICDEVKEMLLDKNRKYGNSALEPKRIFSKASALEQINVRIDDKLSRIANKQADDDEDAERDLLGYLILKLVSKKLTPNA